MAIELNGRQFTWANSLPNPTYKKLDRVLMLTEWEVKYPLVSFYKGLFGDPLDNNISLDEEIIQDITQEVKEAIFQMEKNKEIIKGDIMLMFKDLGQCHTTAYDKGGLSILQYADDTILFLEHDLDKARNMKLILAAFEQRAILNPNPLQKIKEHELEENRRELAWQASF
ncbi:hypothetical protein ACJX0J_024208, partial [Zea mays]